MTFIGTFGFKSGRDIDKFKEINYKLGKTKVPIVLDNTLAYVEAEVINKLSCGTHTIFFANVIEADVLNKDSPMTYEYYHKVKGGFSPKTAPTYYSETDKETKKEEKKMERWVCTVCGYKYDPEKGDPNNGIAPGTKFEDLPEDWTCPVCGAGKDQFEKE